MIIFQITLSGQAIRTLIAIQRQIEGPHDDIPHWVTHGRSLIREGLVTHEKALNTSPPFKFADPKRKHHWEITEKGRLALQVIALDMRDFLVEVVGSERELRKVLAPVKVKR